jgi:hypothetical protein
LRGIGQDRNAGIVLGGRAQHGGAADIDIFDRGGQIAIGRGDGLFEWIQIDHQHVDRLYAVPPHRLIIDAAAPEQTAVDHRMQRLDATIHHFRKAGVSGDFGHFDTRFREQARRAAGRKYFNAELPELLCEFDNTRFVRHADQRAPDGHKPLLFQTVTPIERRREHDAESSTDQ